MDDWWINDTVDEEKTDSDCKGGQPIAFRAQPFIGLGGV